MPAVPTLTTDRELTITTWYEHAGDSVLGIAIGSQTPFAIPVRIPFPGRWYTFTITLAHTNS